MKHCIAFGAVSIALAACAYLPPVEERCGVKVEIGSFPQKIERPGKNPYAWPLGVTEVQAGAPRAFPVTLENKTDKPVSGELEVWMNDDWDVAGPQGPLTLAPGEKKELAYTGTARPRSLNALYPVHARFVRKIATLIQAKAPGLKISACGKTKPSAFDGIQIENFCLGLIHLRSNFLPELQPRREKGFKTTLYVCGSAKTPNTFMFNNLDEGYWLGAYPVMIGFDGFLRWAANSWSKDPYDDASYKTEPCWVPGDIYLIYPGGELSARLIALRAGVVAAEKMRILCEQEGERGKKAAETVKRLAAPYGFRAAVRGFRSTDPCKLDFAAFRRGVEKFVNSEH